MKHNLLKALGLATCLVGAAGAQEAARPAWNWGGDVRVRVDLKNAFDASKPHAATFDKGLKLRVRLGANGELADGKVNWALGLSTMPSGQKAVVSRNLTLAGGNLNGGNAVGIDYAYLKFKPTKRLDIAAGKLKNPFWETDAIFDPDLTPEGVACGLDVYKGAKGAVVTDVTNTLALNALNLGKTANALLVGDQLKANLGPVKTALAGYLYTGLKTVAASSTFGSAFTGVYTKDQMTVLSLKAAYALPFKSFPVTLGVNLFDNVAVKAGSLGYEGRLDMSKVGPGTLALTGRVVNRYATYRGTVDDDFGDGTGYKGVRLVYSLPVYKVASFTVQAFHTDPMKGSGLLRTDRLFLDFSSKF